MFSAVDGALEKLRNEIMNAQTSCLRLFFKCRPQKNVKRTFNFLPNIGPISAVSEPTPNLINAMKLYQLFAILLTYSCDRDSYI